LGGGSAAVDNEVAPLLTYALRRVLVSIPIVLASTFLVFFFVSLTGDPLADLRASPNISQAQLDFVRQSRGLDQPAAVQYWRWLQSIPGDGFGTYLRNDNLIWPDLQRVLGNTLQLVIAAEILSIIVAITLGVVSAKRQYSFFDYSTTTFSFFGFSMPVFWFALILQIIFVNIYLETGVRVFYTASLSSPNPGTGLEFWVDRFRHLALPIMTLMVISVATYSRYMRASMLEVIHSDYVRTARAKGLREGTVTVKHAMRNALIPVVTITALSFGVVLGGAIVTETVFGLDGMGLYFIRYLGQRDPYPIMAWLLVTAIAVVIANLVADLLYGFLDPRIRYD
jgi:peptide/nickel transport system permease protein